MQELWDSCRYPLLRRARPAPTENSGLRSSLRNPLCCTFGHVSGSKVHLVPRAQCRNDLSANESHLPCGSNGKRDLLTSAERSTRLLRLQKLCPPAVPSRESAR